MDSSTHHTHKENKSGRDFFVGDIHGWLAVLRESLHAVKFDYSVDRLFSTGDLIDRGDNSLECLRLTKEPWFHAVQGNHEAMMIERVADDLTENEEVACMHRINGGVWFDMISIKQQAEALELARNLPIARTINTVRGTIGLVHAGWHKNWKDTETIEAEDREAAQWMRYHDSRLQQRVADIDIVVCGHQNDPLPRRIGNQYWIDQIGRTGRLTLVSADQLFREYRNGEATSNKVYF